MTRLLDACSLCCYYGLKCLYWFPVCFVLVIIFWGYYVYVYTLNLSGNFSKPVPVSVVLLLIGHVILFLHLSSYARCVLTRHKSVPTEFQLTDEQLDQMDEITDTQTYLSSISSHLPLHQVTRSGSVRYCIHCEAIKPDRTHHCSTCGRCILKMDHHCPWVNNCVGYSNYKYFFLFLMYTLLLSIWFCLSGLYDVIHLWKGDFKDGLASKFNVTFCFAITGVFGLSTSFLFFYHLYLVTVNKTTIESMDPPHTVRGQIRGFYYLSIKRNLRTIFGSNIFLALLPIDTSEGTGASFPIKSQLPIAEYRRNHTSHSNHTHSNNTTGNNNGHLKHEGDEDHASSESEVEIFAVDDKRTETIPLTTAQHD